jgi:hypothetical protein
LEKLLTSRICLPSLRQFSVLEKTGWVKKVQELTPGLIACGRRVRLREATKSQGKNETAALFVSNKRVQSGAERVGGKSIVLRLCF